MKKCMFVVVPAVLAVFFYSCASSKTGNSMSSIEGDWILTAAVSGGNVVVMPEGINATFSADADGAESFAVYGSAGVNNYSGSVSAAGGKFDHSAFAVTMMAGPEADAAFERVFLSILESAEKAAVSAENGTPVLQLSDASGKNSLTFSAMKLENTSWILSAYNIGNAVSSLPADTQTPELAFDEKGHVSGFTGVNRLIGTCIIDPAARTVDFSALGMTKMGALSKADADLENRYVELLRKASHYQLSGSALRLLDADGTTLLVFVKAV